MIAALLLFALQSGPVVHVAVRDAVTGAPVASAQGAVRGASAVAAADGRLMLSARIGDTLLVRRIGYAAQRVVISAREILVHLSPAALRLSPIETREAIQPARALATVDAAEVMKAGGATVADALARVAFVTARESRGGLSVSMRGARSEQVLVLLDGVPLNDPATGSADLGDIPLAALGSVTAMPGASPSAGPGASGGVLALAGSARSAAIVSAGSYGHAGASASGTAGWGTATLHAGGEWSYARGDYPFRNSVAASITGVADTTELRENNDLHRAAAFLGATWPAAQLALVVARSERGLVGPVNVRGFDRARGETRRALLRGNVSAGEWTITGAARALRFDYDNPPSFHARTSSAAADVEASRRVARYAVRAGAGADRADGTTLRAHTRPRAFVAASRMMERERWRVSLDARADAIGDAGARLSPSVSAERSDRVAVFARVSRAFRAPTFYDLYFASPQRIDPAPSLDPERVTLDVEIGARASAGMTTVSASAFERRTRDAIVWFPGNFAWSPRNVGRERVRGVEARAAVAGAAGRAEAWGSARSTALHLDLDNADVRTPYVARYEGGAVAEVRAGRLAFSTVLTALGRRPTVGIPNVPRHLELPAVFLADLSASWRAPIRATSLFLSIAVHDVGAAAWQPVAGYPTAGRTWTAAITLFP